MLSPSPYTHSKGSVLLRSPSPKSFKAQPQCHLLQEAHPCPHLSHQTRGRPPGVCPVPPPFPHPLFPGPHVSLQGPFHSRSPQGLRRRIMSSFSDLNKVSRPWPRRTLRTSVMAYAWPFTRPHARRASMSSAVTACRRTPLAGGSTGSGYRTGREWRPCTKGRAGSCVVGPEPGGHSLHGALWEQQCGAEEETAVWSMVGPVRGVGVNRNNFARHGGNIYTTEVSKCCKSGPFLFPESSLSMCHWVSQPWVQILPSLSPSFPTRNKMILLKRPAGTSRQGGSLPSSGHLLASDLDGGTLRGIHTHQHSMRGPGEGDVGRTLWARLS